jgi:hypothetical protein
MADEIDDDAERASAAQHDAGGEDQRAGVTVEELRELRRGVHERLDAADPSPTYLDRPALQGEEDLWGRMTLHHPARDIHIRMVNRCTADVIRAWSKLADGADPVDHDFSFEVLMEGGGVVMLNQRALAEVIGISWESGEA